ncbi:hypothetical protein Agub_g1343, partial [Astrephomene gubernaculifera]
THLRYTANCSSKMQNALNLQRRLHVPVHTSPVAARRSHIAFSSTNGFVPSAVALADPSRPSGGPHEIKAQLLSALEGLDRGIFGVPSAKKARILDLIGQLEQHNTHKAPTSNLDLIAGEWRLLFSTITITGVKRTKLGLREFIRLGEFTQHIDTASHTAVNRIEFSVSGLGSLRGALTLRAAYQPVSGCRVDISGMQTELAPPQLQQLFEANLQLLLSIFNPEGHLDITYLETEQQAAAAAAAAAAGTGAGAAAEGGAACAAGLSGGAGTSGRGADGGGVAAGSAAAKGPAAGVVGAAAGAAAAPTSAWRVGRDDKGNVFLLERVRR